MAATMTMNTSLLDGTWTWNVLFNTVNNEIGGNKRPVYQYPNVLIPFTFNFLSLMYHR